MSALVRPVAANTSVKIGTSISTPLVVAGECRSFGAWANPITATSGMGGVLPSQVAGVVVVRRVRLAGRPEVVDRMRLAGGVLVRPPDGGHSHAHSDLVWRA